MFKQLFTEDIITPDNLNVKTSDIGKLNNLYNKSDIYFKVSSINDKMGTSGNYDPTDGRITIQVPPKADLNMLNSVISHELLHREQNKRSVNKYGHWIIKYGNNLNKYIAEFNDRVDANTSTQKEFDKILDMQRVFKLGNSYELMAYAFQLVKTRKAFNAKSPDDIIRFIRDETKIPINNKIKKYIGIYWLIKEQL